LIFISFTYSAGLHRRPCGAAKVVLVVDSALYGLNVDGKGSQRASWFNGVIGQSQNKTSFNGKFDYPGSGGDPYPGIVKNIVITYHCEKVNQSGKVLSSGKAKTYSYGPPEAGYATLSFKCNPGDELTLKTVMTVDTAFYGKNVDGRGSDRAAWFNKNLNTATASFNGKFDYPGSGGDPYPGIVKNIVISYHCDQVASNGSVVSTTTKFYSYGPPEAGYATLSFGC